MEMNVSENEALGTVRIVDPGGDVIGVIADVAPLRRDSDPFQVVSPGFAIGLQRNLGVCLHSHVQQQRTNHQSRPTFACLAVNGHNVPRVLKKK